MKLYDNLPAGFKVENYFYSDIPPVLYHEPFFGVLTNNACNLISYFLPVTGGPGN
jgi:hypothetical protein